MRDHRQYLARLRTQMANERTLMAYARCSLTLIGIGLFVFKFYEEMVFTIAAGLLGLVGFIVAGYGVFHYKRFKQKLLKR